MDLVKISCENLQIYKYFITAALRMPVLAQLGYLELIPSDIWSNKMYITTELGAATLTCLNI